MLIEFNIKNYRSFWESQTLGMTAGSTKDLQEENTFTPPVKGLPRLLRSAVMYGPNGGGKSNLIKALAFMQELVLTSSKESQEEVKTLNVNLFFSIQKGLPRRASLRFFLFRTTFATNMVLRLQRNELVTNGCLHTPATGRNAGLSGHTIQTPRRKIGISAQNLPAPKKHGRTLPDQMPCSSPPLFN